MNHTQLTTPSNPFAFQHECLSLLTGTMPVSGAVAYMVDERSKPVCYQIQKMQPNMHRDYLQSYQKIDPLYPGNFRDEQNASVVKMNDLVPFHLRRTNPYYTDFIEPWDVQDIIELFFRVDGRLIAGAALVTSTQQPEYRSEEIKRLESLHRFIEFSLEQSMQSPRQLKFDNFCDQYALTAKERMVVELVTQGLPNKVIATSLCCGLATVKTHLQHIFAKLGVNSKAEIVSMLYLANG